MADLGLGRLQHLLVPLASCNLVGSVDLFLAGNRRRKAYTLRNREWTDVCILQLAAVATLFDS